MSRRPLPHNMLQEKDCPNFDKHTPHPQNYVAHAEWARKMMKTHHQRQCPGCGLWAIWQDNGSIRIK